MKRVGDVTQQDCDEFSRATKSGQNRPDSFTVDGVEGLSRVNESHVSFQTFLLNLSCRLAHIRGSSRYPDVTPSYRNKGNASVVPKV